MSDKLFDFVKLVKLNGLGIETLDKEHPFFCDKLQCDFDTCNLPAVVIMETFPLCLEHASTLFDRFVPPEKRLTASSPFENSQKTPA